MAITPTLASRRTMALRRMPDTVVVQALTEVHTPDGTTQSYATRSTVACRMSVLSGREVERASQFASEADVVVTMPANTVVKAEDRLVVTKAETSTVHTLEVVHVNKRSEEVTRRVLAQDISTSAT